MGVAVQLGPADRGRPMSLEEYLGGDYAEGFDYELIDGRLEVSPLPDPPHDVVLQWLGNHLRRYSAAHGDTINYISNGARLFVPGRRASTCPEPDLTAFRDFPLHLPFRRIRWQDTSPILVAEVLSPDNPEKDRVRNVELYLQVPSIREYWLVDALADADKPTLIAHRRYRGRWAIRTVAYGATYTTRLLPGFELVVDPRR